MKTPVKDFYGRIIGFIEEDSAGNKTVKDFHGRILGYYKKALNMTTDFYGRRIAQGDQSSMLIGMNLNKN